MTPLRFVNTVAGALAASYFFAAPGKAQAPPVAETSEFPVVSGAFKPDWESLAQYRCPDWFRDAKFGIWAHWTAQSVPEQGDWYARRMYDETEADYKYHLAHYGPQSQVGFKDIDRSWKAENWKPDELMDLYARAGARYFVALANHHDNFDTWNSKYQSWNAVNIGPHQDLIGTWAKAARKRGLRFGVSVHAARAWDWMDVSHGADKQGPYKDVPYDGNLTKADGKGQWWSGYDPAELYGPAGPARTPKAHAGYDAKFYNRTMDLLTSYKPDLLYFDDWEPPTDYGLSIVSNFYNANCAWHKSKEEAVLNVKGGSPRVKQSLVQDFERGQSDAILPQPWQTDTCIGDWHYSRTFYEKDWYKTPDQVIKMLVDIVSKNGNLLLSVPLKGDGSLDETEITFLHSMAGWMSVNKESVFGTRPWKTPGEGPTHAPSGGMSEGHAPAYTASDFRFVTKKQTLYATALGWPVDGKWVIRTLAANAPGIRGTIKKVSLLGHKSTLTWIQTPRGLEVFAPSAKPCDHAWVVKIDGIDLAASTPVTPIESQMPLER